MNLKHLQTSILGCIIGLISLSFSHSLVHAQVVFTDDFSNGYEKWQDVRDTFDLWSIVNELADVFVNRGSTLAELIPKDEYWNDSWKNYVYKVDYTYLEGADKLLSFWFQDPLNWYQFHFVNNHYILSHVVNGYEIWRKTEPFILGKGRTYKLEVHLEDGNIKFVVDGKEIFNVTDPTFDNDYGKIGLKSGAGAVFPTHVQFDNVEVSLISEQKDFILPINPLKQVNPSWKDLEYDSATSWAKENFGIGDWGCLITSINMILNYHNINNFPDGTVITPETLNSWLKKQEDGYLGPGLVNWSAISRLVKQIHDSTGTVNLEYSRIANTITSSETTNNDPLNPEQLMPALTEIQNYKPVILEIPGHFLVGNGYTQNQADLFISDPAYNYELLSQHDTLLKSTRLLTPSYTDLSYMQMSHDENISVNLINESGEIPTTYQTIKEQLTSFPNYEESPEVVIHEFAKPETGTYKIMISSTSQTPKLFNLTIFAYDINANLSNLTYSGVAGAENNPTQLVVNFNKNGQSSISSTTDFNSLLKDIKNLEDNGQIEKHFVAYELEQLGETALKANNQNKIRYIEAIKATINWYSKYIFLDNQEILFQRLNEIEKNL